MPFDIESARKAGYSDQEIAEYLGKEVGFDVQNALKSGYSHADVLEYLSKNERPAQAKKAIDAPSLMSSHKAYNPQEVQTKAERKQSAADAAYEPMFASPTYIDNPMSDKPDGSGMGRRVELGGRAGLQGLGSLAGLAAGSASLSPAGMIFSLAQGKNPFTNAFENYGINPGRAAADAMDLAKPETNAEKYASAGIEGAAATLPTIAFGGLPAIASRFPTLAGALRALPIPQILGGATSGLSSEWARQSGLGPVGQAIAGVAGGAVPLGLASTAVDSGRLLGNTIGRYTTSGRERSAGNLLNEFAKDAEKARTALAENPSVLLEGSKPTLAQLSGDPGLAVLEKGLANVNSTGHGADIKMRYDAQKAARQEALNDVLEPAQQRINEAISNAGKELETIAPGYQRDPQNIGADIRNAYNEGYSAARARTKEAYNSVDPENTSSFDLRPLQESFVASLGPGRHRAIPGESNTILKEIQDDINNGLNGSYADLQNWRKRLSSEAEKAARAGDSNAADIAGKFKTAIDEYLERGAMNPELMGGAPTAKPGTQAYKDASAIAQQSVDQNAWYNDLAFLVQHGLNRDAVEKLGGKAMVEELNRLQPMLVRKGGTLKPDIVSGDLDSFNALTAQTGGGTYFANGDDFLNEVLTRLGSPLGRKRSAQAAIRDATLQENERPHTGFTPEQAAAYQEAKRWRVDQGKRFEEGANESLSKSGRKQDNYAIDNSKIPENYAKSPESIKSFMLSAGESPVARQGLMDYLVGDALKQSTVNGAIDAGKLKGWQQSMSPVLNEMAASTYFPYDMPNLREAVQNVIARQEANKAQLDALKAIAKRNAAENWELRTARGEYPRSNELNLSADDRAMLDAVRNDAIRARDAERAAGVAGSPTAQLQRIENEINGILDKIPGMQKVPGIRNMLSTFLNYVQGNMRGSLYDMLTNAALDPAYALRLMNKATAKKPYLLPQVGMPQTLNSVRAMMQGMQGNQRKQGRR